MYCSPRALRVESAGASALAGGASQGGGTESIIGLWQTGLGSVHNSGP